MSSLNSTRYYEKLIEHNIKDYAAFMPKQRLTIHFTNAINSFAKIDGEP